MERELNQMVTRYSEEQPTAIQVTARQEKLEQELEEMEQRIQILEQQAENFGQRFENSAAVGSGALLTE